MKDVVEHVEEEYQGPVKVTVTRLDNGEILREQVLKDDYLIICNGTRYVKSWQMWGRTHQFNIAVRDPRDAPDQAT